MDTFRAVPLMAMMASAVKKLSETTRLIFGTRVEQGKFQLDRSGRKHRNPPLDCMCTLIKRFIKLSEAFADLTEGQSKYDVMVAGVSDSLNTLM